MTKPTRFLAPLTSVNLLMVMAMLLIGVVNTLWAERLTVNDGLGWDGKVYAGFVKNFPEDVFVNGVPNYYAQRVLPSGIVHYGMRLFSLPFENRNIIRAFEIYNLILLLVSTYFWGRIADQLKIQSRGKWFGFCFLFLNYAILKNNFYHSVLTDTTAFALGILMLYFFLIDSRMGLLAVILVGGFSWPTIPFMAALLYVSPRPRDLPTTLPEAAVPFRLNLLLAALVALLTMTVMLYLTGRRLPERIDYFALALRIHIPLLYLSIIGVVSYLFLSLKTLLADRTLFEPSYLFSSVNWRRAITVVAVLILLKIAQHQISSGEEIGWGGIKGFVIHTFLSSLTEPLIFLVAHAIYYGPVILLLIFFWQPFCRSLHNYGLGMKAFVLLNLLMSINPQSRYQINAVTVFIVLLVKLLDQSVLKRQSLVLWVLLCLISSKVWYRFNTAPQVFDDTMDSLLRFPLQHYFMSSGPWMSAEMYYVQGTAVALTAILLYFLIFKRRRDHAMPDVAGKPVNLDSPKNSFQKLI